MTDRQWLKISKFFMVANKIFIAYSMNFIGMKMTIKQCPNIRYKNK